MSYIADYCFDMALEQQARYDDEVSYYMALTDDELRKMTSASRKPIIISIRKAKKMSHKQRLVLARWLAYMDERHPDIDS